MAYLSLIAAALLAGCAWQRIEGWPEHVLMVEHYVPHAEMLERCGRYAALPVACAEWDLNVRECHIWYSADFPPSAWVVSHERKHCQGWTHP